MIVENRELLNAMHPGNMEELIAFFSWDRPGIPDDIINCYLQNKSDPTQIVYEVPELEPILKETYGCLIYQEQIDRIVHEIGGFTLDKSESVRRDVAKRKQSGLRKTRESFIKGNKEEKIPGCVSKGISEDTANTIFDRIYDQAPYCFNKAHAAAIAFMAYSMAWLKYHYRGEYAEVIRVEIIRKIQRSIFLQQKRNRTLRVMFQKRNQVAWILILKRFLTAMRILSMSM